MKLKEILIYDDDVENYLNPDGSKKPWPHKRDKKSIDKKNHY